jgi:tetratricopeptide (TPR) repeat protein/transcriptional regulator with XRE-family HTH domain
MAFGAEMRRRRLERGYSLSELAKLVYYSKGHLSKIENGVHLPQMEYAWQLDAVLSADGELVKVLSDAAAAEEHPPPPTGLGHESPWFVGRSAELETLKAELCAMPPASRTAVVCAIDGMPGVGKTALASRVALALTSRFPDGVVFLDLHGYTGSVPPLSPDDVLDRLLRRFDRPVPIETDERAARLGTHLMDRSCLIVLDNARNAAQVRPVIPPTSGSRLLVTSRNRLAALDIAFHLSLGPLSQDEGEQLLHAIAGPAETQSTRAQQISDVVRECGGLPLALTIVAARLRTGTTLADLRRSLTSETDRPGEQDVSDRLDELADDERSVASAFELSYRAQAEEVRCTFARLGLLPGDWTIPYVSVLDRSSLSSAVRRVEQLMGARLIERDVDGRFRFHDLIAAFARRTARTELPAEMVRLARQDIVTWAVDMTFRADALIEPHRHRPPYQATSDQAPFSGDQEAAGWLRAECRNLAALCREAHTWGLDALCWQLAYALRGHFFLAKQWDEWEATHTTALAAALRAGDVAAEAMTRNNLGVALMEMGRPDAANEHFQAVLGLGTKPGLEYARANALANYGWVLYLQGSWADSLQCNRQALRFYIEHDMQRNAAITLRSIALDEIELELFGEALSHLRDALSTFATLGLALNAVMAKNCLGEAYMRMGELDHAEHWLLEAAEEARQSRSHYEEARALRSLGEIALTHGDQDAAVGRWRAALDLYEEIGAPEATEVSGRMALI